MTFRHTDPSTTVLPAATTPSLVHAARWTANLLELWRYCAHATCRRAHRCRGDGIRCIRCYKHRVPPHVYRRAVAIQEAHLIRQAHAEQIRDGTGNRQHGQPLRQPLGDGMMAWR